MPGNSTSPTSTVGLNTINIQQLLTILTTQLQNQDPNTPISNEAFITQIAQFAELEQVREQNLKSDKLLFSQSATASIGLLGKEVNYIVNGQGFTGTVSALGFSNGVATFTVDKSNGTQDINVKLEQIDRAKLRP